MAFSLQPITIFSLLIAHCSMSHYLLPALRAPITHNLLPIIIMKIFIHGLESSNQGTKSIFFRERYPDMIIPNFTGELPERMEKLNKILSGNSGIRIVGSSFGGLMGSIFAMENQHTVDKLILLAPAINLLELSGYQSKGISVPVVIYHGKKDNIIPLEEAEYAARKYFHNLTFNKVEDDHFLYNTFHKIDWDTLLTDGVSP
jgi:predicted esterase